MKKSNWLRLLGYCIILVTFLAYGGTRALAAPPAPVLLSPGNGSTIIEPVLEWQAVTGAAYYKVDLSTSSTFVTLNYTYTTYNTRITPAKAIENTTFYWRVSSVDSGDHVGTPSGSWSFIKNIPPPTLLSPTNGSSIIEPVLQWQAVAGAAYYKVDLSTSSTFVTLDHTYNTYNTQITPATAIDHATYYWRVSGVDAQDHVGAASDIWSFVKNTLPPTLLTPYNDSWIIEPVLEWQAVAGAAYYKVDLSTSSTFVPLDHTYTTYNTRITPASAIDNTTYYWRVSGVDAGDHVGAASGTRSFVKYIPPPTLLSPADRSGITEPVLEWQAVEGAAYYKVEMSTSATFVPVNHTYTTYNTRITPANAIENTTFYWRVSGVDAGDHVGFSSGSRTFTLGSPPAPTDITPQLLTPADAATIVTDPNFTWTRVIGAAEYHLIISRDPGFGSSYDYTITDYASFTPYVGTPTAGQKWAYPNDTYYWYVQARNASHLVIATSSARSFTKLMTLPLGGPDDATTLTADPTFQWTRVVGADHYYLIVSKNAGFSSAYDYALPDYVSFTPYVGTAGQEWTYPNGTYYWKVEARDHNGTAIVTSPARSFTKQMTLPLIGPGDGDVWVTDPTFQWTRVVGADHYYLIVSKNPGFSSAYDYALPDYVSFTPYVGTAGQEWTYPNGTYYWKVEARDHGGTAIVTSEARSFTKQMTLPLIAPVDGAGLAVDPTFQWTRVVGAYDYYLIVSKNPGFTTTYDHALPDYVSFTPYVAPPPAGQRTAYGIGTYYWKVEARDHGGTATVTSLARSFTIGVTNLYLPLIFR